MEDPEDFGLGSISFEEPVAHTARVTYRNVLNGAGYGATEYPAAEQNVESAIIAIAF